MIQLIMKRTVLAIICFNQKVLFFQRENIPSIPNPDKWQFPGGHFEEGETPDESIRRELSEEVTYVPTQLTYIGALKTLIQEINVYWSYVTEEESEKFKLGSDEGQTLKFLSIEEALQYDLTDNVKYYLATFKSLLSKHLKERTVPNPSEFGIKD